MPISVIPRVQRGQAYLSSSWEHQCFNARYSNHINIMRKKTIYFCLLQGLTTYRNFSCFWHCKKNFNVYDITLRVLLNLIIFLFVDNYAIVTVIRFKFKTKFGFLIDCYLTWKFSCVKHLVECICASISLCFLTS